MSSFNFRLKSLRQEFKLSQMELATQIGLSKSSINMYERGEREPGIETIKKFASFFNVDTDYLLGKTEQKLSLDESTLTEGEKTLLEAFRKLTPKNQEIALCQLLEALEAMQ